MYMVSMISAIIILLQVFFFWVTVKKSIDLHDINVAEDDRVVYNSGGQSGVIFIGAIACFIGELLFAVIDGGTIVGIYLFGLPGVIIHILWFRCVVIYDSEKISFGYFLFKQKSIYYKDIEFLRKKRYKRRGGYDGKHLYTTIYVWSWSIYMNNKYYHIGESGDKKFDIFLDFLKKRYFEITGKELTIEYFT